MTKHAYHVSPLAFAIARAMSEHAEAAHSDTSRDVHAEIMDALALAVATAVAAAPQDRREELIARFDRQSGNSLDHMIEIEGSGHDARH